jgi:hypothetical protein
LCSRVYKLRWLVSRAPLCESIGSHHYDKHCCFTTEGALPLYYCGPFSRLSLSVPLWNVPWPKEWNNWCARADLEQRAQAGRVRVYVILT